MDIAAWLRQLGLERYEEAFRANEVTPEALPELTDADLRELGLPLGPRRVLLKASRDLTGSLPAADPGEPARAQAGPNAEAAVPGAKAERRQLTVMFVDLVGSTALSATLDPEEMRELIRAYQNAVAGEVTRFEGHIAKYMGDGVLAYFGWPKAHEDEAERAVRSGLGMIETVGRLTAPGGNSLTARIGIATGEVVVGDLIGQGDAQEAAVVGETPNLAARLQALAEPGSIVISRRTQRLVGGLFELADLGPQHLKGFVEPVGAWQVIGLGGAESRFEAMHMTGLTPLVGREHELGLMLDRWSIAQDGEGQVVLLSGEAGIGKSRIGRALLGRLGEEPYTRLRYYCSPYHTNSALHPVIEQLERAAGFGRDDPPPVKLDKLEAVLGPASSQITEVAPFLAALLSIPSEGRYAPLNLTPQAQKARTFEALLAQLEGLATAQPILMIFEDAHWIDPTTSELFALVIDRLQRQPILLLITFRPEFAPPWAGHAHITTLTLNRLSRNQGATMVARLTDGKALPGEVLQQILEKTDGVPLFVEELTKTVLELGLLADAGDQYELRGPLPPLAIPSTLHDSLLARLARLAPVKEIAQIGAAIGREFSHALLAAVADRPEAELQAALDQLISSELLFRRGTPPEATYTFKHALVQDAAYGTLLKPRRRQLLGRIVSVLEQQFPETVATQPELLARHCTEAGLPEEAVEYWYRAGRLASERSALAEAIGHFGKALELLAALPDPLARREREIDLQIALGGALISAKGHAAPETGRAYARAQELCRQVGDRRRSFPLLFGQWAFHMVRAEHAAAKDIAEELLRSAERTGDVAGLVVGHRTAGIGSLWRGELLEARGYLERMLALYDPERHRSLASVYAYDPRLAGLVGLAFALFLLGYPEQAVERCRQAVDDAERLSHPAGLAYALYLACMLDQIRQDVPSLRKRVAPLVALAAEQGFARWEAAGAAFDGWALVERGQAVEGIARIERGVHAWKATGARLQLPLMLNMLADGLRRVGRFSEALDANAEADRLVRTTGEHWYEAMVLWQRGQLLDLQANDSDLAEASFRESIEVARRQQAKLPELRASISLAQLWAHRGKRTEARELLAPVYSWFTEGFETADLKEAKALLDELG